MRVNDRGPFVDGRIIDLSRGAADALDLRRAGVGLYRVLVGPWPDATAAERSRRAVMSRGYPEATTISGS